MCFFMFTSNSVHTAYKGCTYDLPLIRFQSVMGKWCRLSIEHLEKAVGTGGRDKGFCIFQLELIEME